MSTRPSARAAAAARLLEPVGLAVGLGLVALIAARPLASADTFWHLELGEIIARTRAIPQQDLFSAVHPERPWVQFAWLWELGAFALVDSYGLTGLRLGQSALMALSFFVLYALMRLGVGRERGALERALPAAFVAACALVLFADRFQARPDAPNLLLSALAAPLLLGGYRRAGVRHGLLVFALALLWTNLHAGTSLLLPASLGLCAAGATLNRLLRAGPSAGGLVPAGALRAWALCGVALLALAISPGALRGLLHFAGVFGSIVDAREPEWSPSFVMLAYGSHPALLLIATAPLLIGLAYAAEQIARARRLGRAGIDFAELALSAAYLVLAAAIVRNVFLCLFPLACLVLRAVPSRRLRIGYAIGALLLTAIATDYATRDALSGFDNVAVAYTRDLAPDAYPEHAATFLREAGIEGRILNFPRWGDYLIWRLFPACRVLLDTRRNVTRELWGLSSAATDPAQRRRVLDHAFERLGLDLVVYEGPVFAGYRPEGDWRLLYKAGPEEVYLHARSPRAAQSLARAGRYYAQRDLAPGSDPTAAAWIDTATRAGGSAWLAHPFRVHRRAQLQQAAEHGDAAERARAQRGLGVLYFRAGAYAAAIPELQAALLHDGTDGSARYHLGFAKVLSGERAAGLQLLRAFPPEAIRRLTPAQAYRLQQLLHAAPSATLQ